MSTDSHLDRPLTKGDVVKIVDYNLVREIKDAHAIVMGESQNTPYSVQIKFTSPAARASYPAIYNFAPWQLELVTTAQPAWEV